MSVQPLQGPEELLQSFEVGDRGFGGTKLEGLGNSTLLVSIVCMEEEDMRFPSLSNFMLAMLSADVEREFEALEAQIRGISRLNRVAIRSTYFQEPCVLAFLHALFDQLKRLLQILPVNRILDLVVPTQKDWVIGRRHF